MANVNKTEQIVKKPKVDEVMGEFGSIGNISQVVQSMQDALDYRGVTVDQLVQMTRNDAQVRGILNSIKSPIKMARAKIVNPKDPNAVEKYSKNKIPTDPKAAPVVIPKYGEEERQFIEKNLLSAPCDGGMEIPIREIAATMATAVRDGYKIFEQVWEQRDGKIWLKKLAYRSNLCTWFKYDGNGNITGAWQQTTVNGLYKDVRYPKEKIAYFIFNKEENPYVGESAFIPVFYHYDKKHKLYAIAHLSYQLNAIPIRLGKHPSSLRGDELLKFRDSLKGLGTAMAMTFPNTCEVEKLESTKSLTEFMPLIQHHDSMMSKAFLTQFMNLGSSGGGGSFALSNDQSDMFLMAVIGLLHDIEEVFNSQIIPPLIDWNFGTKKYPKLMFAPFSDAARSIVVEMFKTMLGARFPNISPEFSMSLEESVSEELGLNLDYDEIKDRQAQDRQKLIDAQLRADAEPVNPTNNRTASGVPANAPPDEEDEPVIPPKNGAKKGKKAIPKEEAA